MITPCTCGSLSKIKLWKDAIGIECSTKKKVLCSAEKSSVIWANRTVKFRPNSKAEPNVWSVTTSLARFFCEKNPFNPLTFPLTSETNTQKRYAILKIFKFWTMKFIVIKKNIWQFCKIDVLVNFILQKLKFWKIAQLFLSVSLLRGNLRELRVFFSGLNLHGSVSQLFNYQTPMSYVTSLMPHDGRWCWILN